MENLVEWQLVISLKQIFFMIFKQIISHINTYGYKMCSHGQLLYSFRLIIKNEIIYFNMLFALCYAQ